MLVVVFHSHRQAFLKQWESQLRPALSCGSRRRQAMAWHGTSMEGFRQLHLCSEKRCLPGSESQGPARRRAKNQRPCCQAARQPTCQRHAEADAVECGCLTALPKLLQLRQRLKVGALTPAIPFAWERRRTGVQTGAQIVWPSLSTHLPPPTPHLPVPAHSPRLCAPPWPPLSPPHNLPCKTPRAPAGYG